MSSWDSFLSIDPKYQSFLCRVWLQYSKMAASFLQNPFNDLLFSPTDPEWSSRASTPRSIDPLLSLSLQFPGLRTLLVAVKTILETSKVTTESSRRLYVPSKPCSCSSAFTRNSQTPSDVFFFALGSLSVILSDKDWLSLNSPCLYGSI